MNTTVTFTSADPELQQKLERAESRIEHLQATVDRLKAMLPKCETCNGTGIGGGGLYVSDCPDCGGLGVRGL